MMAQQASGMLHELRTQIASNPGMDCHMSAMLVDEMIDGIDTLKRQRDMWAKACDDQMALVKEFCAKNTALVGELAAVNAELSRLREEHQELRYEYRNYACQHE